MNTYISPLERGKGVCQNKFNSFFLNLAYLRDYIIRLTSLFVLVGLISSCQSVKPYQRKYLNDSAMRMGKISVASFETNAEAIREGASSGQTKSTGGCGCN